MTDAGLQLVVFDIQSHAFGLRLTDVERVVHSVETTPLPESPEHVAGAISIAGVVVPVFDLRGMLGLPPAEIGLSDVFVIARARKRLIALVADAVRSVTDCGGKSIVPAADILPRLRRMEGVVQLDDGMVLIQNLSQMLSLEQEQQLDEAIERHWHHEQ